jgi:hypothetical protein
MCDFITHTKNSFHDFRTSKSFFDGSGIVDLPEFVNMPGAQSLRELKQLRLAFDDSNEVQWRQCYPPILRAIISNLTSLEELVLAMDIHASWSPDISQMVHLKELTWYAHLSLGDDAEEGAEAVRNAFSNVENRRVEIEVLNTYGDVELREIHFSN